MRRGWAHQLHLGDIWRESAEDGSEWEKTRDATITRIKNDGWCKQFLDLESGPMGPEHLGWLIVDLEQASDLEEFNEVWDQIYDWADVNRLWLQVF